MTWEHEPDGWDGQDKDSSKQVRLDAIEANIEDESSAGRVFVCATKNRELPLKTPTCSALGAAASSAAPPGLRTAHWLAWGTPWKRPQPHSSLCLLRWCASKGCSRRGADRRLPCSAPGSAGGGMETSSFMRGTENHPRTHEKRDSSWMRFNPRASCAGKRAWHLSDKLLV